MRNIYRHFKSQKGSAAIIIALSMTVLLGFTALAIDVGVITSEKSRISKAADAAALAGAQELIMNKSNAINIANQYLEKNGVDPIDAQIVVSDSDTKISVTINKEVNYYFAGILGFDKGIVETEAVAICAPVIGVYEGIRPFAIEQQTLDFNQTYTLKEGAGSGSNGNYGGLALGGNGASTYVSNIVEGYDGYLRVGDFVDTEPGNMSGPTAQGINTLISHCTHVPECTHNHYSTNCPRIITVIMVETLDVNGRAPVKIVGFAKFFLIGVEGHGRESIVTGKFLRTVTTGELDETQTDFGLKGVKLIK
jgi:hypothetical protein